MKKTTLLFLSALLCLLMLTGCECKHTWTDADCLTAKTCTECGVVEGEALGHDWKAATCDAPETCSRCSETQGEALEHIMGKWGFTDSTMVRACELCGMEEVTDIDRELFVKEEIAGYYDFYFEMNGETQTSIHQIRSDIFAPYVNIYEDGTIDIFMNTLYKCTWEYVEYADKEDYDVYTIRFQGEEEGFWGTINCFYTEESVTLNMPVSETAFWLFVDNAELAPHMVGTWVTSAEGNVYTLTLNEDRTFTADFGEEISGIWQLRFPYVSNGYRYGGLALSYERNGETITTTDTAFDLGSEDTTIEEYVSNYFYIGAHINDELGYEQFQKMDEETIEKLRSALDKGAEVVLGDWTSVTKSIYYYDGRDREETETTDYSISLRKDGTFTLKLEEEKTGTWRFDDARVDEWSTSYSYALTFDGETESKYSNLYVQQDGSMEFHFSTATDTESITYSFVK